MASGREVLVIYGTRPEAIKLAPLVLELRGCHDVDVSVAVTGQHREILDQVHEVFGIVPDHDLDICRPRQTLAQVTIRAMAGLTRLLKTLRPAAVVVQGDTTTALAGALASYYQHVPVVHVEAGLRAGLRDEPFPEEMNRRLIAQLADLHLAPTPQAAANLKAEGLPTAGIVVTGNTVIDALLVTVGRPPPYRDTRIQCLLDDHERVVLVTAHRRESWGAPMGRIATALARLARSHPDVGFVLPAHPNPAVREVLVPPVADLDNVLVVEPLPYGEFCRLVSDSVLVLTDSGGVQEEAPTLGKPVLVLRDVTERPEGLAAGVAQLVGTGEDAVVAAVEDALRCEDCWTVDPRRSPYGDGRAAERSVAAIRALLGIGDRIPDFEPGGLW